MAPDTAAEQKRQRAKTQARKAMREAALGGSVITYTELVDKIDAPIKPRDQALTVLLCEISRATNEREQILLSAVVVRADTRRPGDGFLELVRELGRSVEDEEEAWRREVNRVYAAYGAPTLDAL